MNTDETLRRIKSDPCRHCRHRLVNVLRPIAAAVIYLYNERFRAFDGEFINSANDTAHGVVRQRTDSRKIVQLFDLLFRREYRRAR